MAVICTMPSMHIGQFDLTEIQLMAELAELRKLSAAASRIGLSQSAASHALMRLRERLGDPLFTRTPTGFQPTPYGHRLALAAREALGVLAAGLESNKNFEPGTSTRRFTYYANDVGQTVSLPKLVAFFKVAAPHATLRVAPVPLEDPGAALACGEVDLAFGPFDNLTAGFRQSVVFRERYVCIVRTDHPRFPEGMTLEAFKGSEQAMADATGLAHGVIDRFLARHGIERNVVLRVPGFHVLPPIIAASDLVAVIPGRLAASFAPRVAIKVLPLPLPIPPFEICLYWHERYDRDPAVRWFRKSFVQVMRAD